MDKNPFIYGEVVGGDDFCDREKEQEKLLRDLSDGERIFLISPRRLGKSSLISVVAEQLRKKRILVAYLDLFSPTSAEVPLKKA